MNTSLRLALLAGLSALALPAAAQQVTPAPVLTDEPAPVTSPSPKSKVTLPPDLAAPPAVMAPVVAPWSVANAQKLLVAIQGIGSEGLDPKDYKPADLKTAIAAGPSPALDQLASQMFAWLVEDLRDGRTPMNARKQWFVVDPDAEALPTDKVMADALASGDIAGKLAALDPTVPDFAALRD